MRGKKAKALRQQALRLVQHGLKLAIHKPAQGQQIAEPFRCLYQALKQRRSIAIIGEDV